jgi:PPOX class probable F420-dependent enzyme
MEKSMVTQQVKIDPKVREFLEERRFAVLATINPDGTVQQTVMWYALHGDTIMMNTRRGRVKDHNLLRDRRISICVEDEYRYVTIAGTVEIDDDPDRGQASIKELAIRYDGVEEAERMMRDVFGGQHRVTLLIPIEKLDAHGFDGD